MEITFGKGIPLYQGQEGPSEDGVLGDSQPGVGFVERDSQPGAGLAGGVCQPCVGFVDRNSAMPPRYVELSGLYEEDGAVFVRNDCEAAFEKYHQGATDYDLGGMILRIDLEPGVHRLEVTCTGGEEDMLISVSGVRPDKIRETAYWDAAELVPHRHRAFWNGNVWSYSFAHGQPFLELEIEPLKPHRPVGIRRVLVEPVESIECQSRQKKSAKRKEAEGNSSRPERPRTTLFILGDSTAKSYVFEEAPMSGWGQCFYQMVDEGRAQVVNYSAGGRSLKTMYVEGRFHDLLLNGREGDYVFLQSGHNDERNRNVGQDPDGERIRYGGGSTEEMYYRFLTEIFLPAIRARGMIPVLVTPVTRIDGGCDDDAVFRDSFTNRRFPQVMRKAALDTGTLLLDLNRKSVAYFNEVGGLAARALVMAVEPGESPGKTNSGSYANGNPGSHPDGTHYKEALSKQYCRMAAEEIYSLLQRVLAGDLSERGRVEIEQLYGLLSEKVRVALEKHDFAQVFPEVCVDTCKGPGAYYRNQIEKLVQLGIFHKAVNGCFYPWKEYTIREFARAISTLWHLPGDFAKGYQKGSLPSGDGACQDGILTRLDAACLLYDAYGLRFGFREEDRPPYMMDYNGITICTSDPNYDSNIPIGETVYYPLVPVDRIRDLDGLGGEALHKVRSVYSLGLMRSEAGIKRGSLKNGELFEPEKKVTREKAAKLLYFCFVLDKRVKIENHRIDV